MNMSLLSLLLRVLFAFTVALQHATQACAWYVFVIGQICPVHGGGGGVNEFVRVMGG